MPNVRTGVYIFIFRNNDVFVGGGILFDYFYWQSFFLLMGFLYISNNRFPWFISEYVFLFMFDLKRVVTVFLLGGGFC